MMRVRTLAVLVLAFATLALSAAAAEACTKTWTGGTGNWNTPGDWTPSGVPQEGAEVCITEPGAYTVTLSRHAEAGGFPASVTVGASSGTQTLDVVGESYVSSGNQTVHNTYLGALGTISLNSHTKLILDTTAGGTSTNSEPLGAAADVEAGTFQDSGEILVETSDSQWETHFFVNTLNLGSGSSLDLESGHAVVAKGSSWSGTNKGTITVHSGASLELTPGGTGATATLTNEGSVANQGTISMYKGEWIQKAGSLSGNAVVIKGSKLADSAGTGAFVLPEGGDTLTGTIPSGQTVTATDPVHNEIAGFGLGKATLTNDGRLVFAGPGNEFTEGQLEVVEGAITNKGVIESSSGSTRRVDLHIAINNQPGGLLDITGGVLEADRYAQIDNSGLIEIAPGAILGTTSETHSANESSGTLSPEIASASSFGQVRLEGGSHLAAGGTLAPVLTGGYVPANGTEFDVFGLDGGSLDGSFAAVSNGFSADYAHTESGYVGVVYGSSSGGGGTTASTATTATPTNTASTKPAGPTLKLEHVKVSARRIEVTLKVSQAGTVTITGAGLAKTVVKVKAGTVKIRVALSKAGRADRAHHRKIKVEASLKAAGRSVVASEAIKL
jgi:hypothetical protein